MGIGMKIKRKENCGMIWKKKVQLGAVRCPRKRKKLARN
jgi:hypothetical protein